MSIRNLLCILLLLLASCSEDIAKNNADDIRYSVKIIDGLGEGLYLPGDLVKIDANQPGETLVFHSWNSPVNHLLADSLAPSTQFVMPARNLTFTAVYDTVKDYKLSVIRGSGSGIYEEGDTITLIADSIAKEYRFIEWYFEPELPHTYDRYSDTLKISMPDNDLVATAGFRNYNVVMEVKTSSKTAGIGDTLSIWTKQRGYFTKYTFTFICGDTEVLKDTISFDGYPKESYGFVPEQAGEYTLEFTSLDEIGVWHNSLPILFTVHE